MRIFLAAILLVPLLAACGQTATGDAIRTAIRDRGALAADAALENTEWALCNAASIGAVHRRYAPSPSRFEHWRGLCGYE